MAKSAGADAEQGGRRERRTGADRRVKDQPALVKGERRRGIEPRRPEIVEIDMSASEWGALVQDFEKPEQV
ncbi:hypothetical protein PFX98_19515 [Paucibacter sediminis]|uniref:Uncharacterized protein n=1 Tax=Paucibacter sediminis TaxID=3019553 RepID=A0AA95NFE7_9BURK|nr:hypothetical protein [Paucibacter sp. S2-9]WIT11073.1 hypothetical protein PFX98_19515 [Paucibacter sp. S2-9]